MPRREEPVKPRIDDKFWFERSGEWVKSSSSSRNEAAAKLQTMIVWLWGIYTASATIGMALGTALSETSYPILIIVLIASPSTVLIGAYWVAVWAQVPISVKFDPRMPDDIKKAYLKGIRAKKRKLNAALALSLLAAVLVSFAIVAAYMSKQVTPSNFQAYLYASEEQNVLILTGHVPADIKMVHLRIIPYLRPGGPAKPKEDWSPTPGGKLQKRIELDSATYECKVTVEWKDEGTHLVHSLTRTVRLKSNPKQI